MNHFIGIQLEAMPEAMNFVVRKSGFPSGSHDFKTPKCNFLFQNRRMFDFERRSERKPRQKPRQNRASLAEATIL